MLTAVTTPQLWPFHTNLTNTLLHVPNINTSFRIQQPMNNSVRWLYPSSWKVIFILQYALKSKG